MAEPSAKSFLKILERSGIVAEDRLKQSLARLSRKFNGAVVTTDDLSSHLLESGLITPWHVEKLLAGKYKGFFLGKYKLLGHLGTGGMSTVFLAEHKLSGQKRAIKVLPRKKVPDKSYLDRFYREGKAAASLNHPNIVRIYDICNENDTHYMVMEWVEGQDLYEVVKEFGPLDFKDAANAIAQACIGLSHAHERSLVHRDIKPANLLRTKSGNVKILDLGLALLRADDEESLTILHNEKVMGTADYLAPEQAVNSHEVDHRADIYSLGCTLYYLLTGHPPFPNGSLAQRIAMHQTREPAGILKSRPDCPEALVYICHEMMRKQADDRPQTAARVESMLRDFVKTGEVSSRGPAIAIDTSGRSQYSDSAHNDPDGGLSAEQGLMQQGQTNTATAVSPGPFDIDVNTPIGTGSSKKGFFRKGNSGKGSGKGSGRNKGSGKNKGSGTSNAGSGTDNGQAVASPVAATNAGQFPSNSAPVVGSIPLNPSIKKRKKQAIPIWAVLAMILIMFAILLVVLSIVFSFIDNSGPVAFLPSTAYSFAHPSELLSTVL